MMLSERSYKFRTWVLDRLQDVSYVHSDGVTARCPVCRARSLAVVFAGTASAADALCVEGCAERDVWATLRRRRAA